MKFLRITFLLFFFSPIHAQIADLLKNDSITWVAEWDADYLIDDFDATDTVLNNGLSVIKYLQKDERKPYKPKNFFSGCLWDAIEADKIKVFSDYDLKKVINNEAALYLGRMRRWYNNESEIDSTIYDVGFNCMPVSYQPRDAKFYRTHQIIYYNAPKAQFRFRVLAIAPLIESYSETTKEETLEPLFWFKPEMSKPNLFSDDIVWVQKVVTKKNSLDFKKAKVLKNTMTDNLANHFFQSFENQMDIPFWGVIKDDYVLDKLNSLERRKLLNPIDTLLVIDPNTYEMKAPVTSQRHYYSKDINSIRLYQEWFWDDKQNKLFIHLKSAAAMIAVKDESGERLFDAPLFYRKTDD
jgi:hypothetical protein